MPYPGSDSTAEIRNKEGIKDVIGIILTLFLVCILGSERYDN